MEVIGSKIIWPARLRKVVIVYREKEENPLPQASVAGVGWLSVNPKNLPLRVLGKQDDFR